MPTARTRQRGRFTADFGMCPKHAVRPKRRQGGFGWMVKLLPLLTGTMSGIANTAYRKAKGGGRKRRK